jgi:periplasmic protein TonB
MMNTLLESRPHKKRAAGGTIFSVILHASVVLLAVFATARAGVAKSDEPVVQKVNFIKTAEPKPVEKKPDTPPPPKAKPVVQHHAAAVLPPAPKAEIAPPKGFKVLQAPVAISTKIPDIDLSSKFNPDDFSGKGVKGGSSTGSEGSNGTKEGAAPGVDTNKDYDANEVERQVSAISGTNIAYPESMRSSAVEGRVEAQFVVNENGRVETGSFKVLNSTNEAFTQAVRDALSKMRFRPAQIGKTNVAQVVQQAFVFNLNK